MSEYGGTDYAGRSVGGGRYQLQRLLGEGGMASVHLAHDTVLDRQVAIKTLHTELGREDSFRERFRREAQAVARLSHPNVVSVFDTGEDTIDDARVPYIVMEYVEGRPLRTVLDEDVRQYGAMPTEKALKITSDVLAALDASHEMGLVHRDIKPGNVMLDRRGVVKVMDFGIARAVQSGVTSMTQTGMVVGTPQYLSPEQALGRGVDARSDLYSVGVMLFELLTGRLPFDADSPLAIAYAHVQEQPVAPSSINRTVPQVADALVARALAKNPNDRFPSAESMREEARRAGGMTPAGAIPSVVAGDHARDSGAAVAQAVFPPVNPAAGPYNSPPPGTPNPYQQGYGGFGPATPAGQPMAAQQHGFATPPPYSLTPTPAPAPGGGGGGNRKLTWIVTAVVAAIAVLATVIVVVVLNSGSDGGGTPEAKDSSPAAQSSGGESKKSYIPPDRSRTIDKDKCSHAYPYYNDKSKVDLPDFTYKDYRSVRECLRAAGWDYTTEKRGSNLWGKDIVLEQFPDSSTAFDPDKDEVKLVLSTGYPE